MREFLNNILPRIKAFSKEIDISETIIEKPWIWVDSEGTNQKMVFRRGGELLMIQNGDVKSGKWEYILALNSFLIDRISDKILLNYAFVNDHIMLLKRDGNISNEVLTFINQDKLPSLDFEGYLNTLANSDQTHSPIKINSKLVAREHIPIFKKKRSLKLVDLSKEVEITVYDDLEETDYAKANNLLLPSTEECLYFQDKVLETGYFKIPNDVYNRISPQYRESQNLYYIQDGLIKETFKFPPYAAKINGKEVCIYFKVNSIMVGSLVLYKLSHQPLEDGNHKYGFMSYITVKNGRVTEEL